MRIFVLFYLLLVAIFALLVFIKIYGYSFEQLRENVDSMLEDVIEEHEINISLDEYSIEKRMTPLLQAMNYVLIIAFIACIFGIFLYARKRR